MNCKLILTTAKYLLVKPFTRLLAKRSVQKCCLFPVYYSKTLVRISVMANQQHLDILKQGREVWNEWREKNRYIKIDLSKANLTEFDLIHTDLSSANLRGAYIGKNDLSGACLKDANLTWSHLSGANLN